jgi:hypothetical protein
MIPAIEMNVTSSVLSVAGFLLLWLAVYFFRQIVRDAEKLEKKGLGSGLILAALPLILLQPLIASYFYITTGKTIPAELAIVTTGAFCLAAVLLMVPVVNLTRLSKSMRVPWAFLAIFLVVYPIAGLVNFHDFPLLYLSAQALYLLAELILGIGFILLSRYTSDFKELNVDIMGKKFSTHYNLSSFLMITGIALPMNAIVRGAAIDSLLHGGATGVERAQELRLLANILLTGIALGGAIGMLVFKITVEEFCMRFGSMEALLKKEDVEKAKGVRRKR